jgi:hypothetical protein
VQLANRDVQVPGSFIFGVKLLQRSCHSSSVSRRWNAGELGSFTASMSSEESGKLPLSRAQ